MNYAGHWGAVSGTMGVSCARHMFVLPGSGVDLQKGERYASLPCLDWTLSRFFRFANVDFAIVSSCQYWMPLEQLAIAYDINCQYRIYFWKRMLELAARFPEFESVKGFFMTGLRLIAGVGKFHLLAHNAACHYVYSFRYLPGVGMTDGEAVERIWSALNGIALRTREMASGHRHDVINDFHDYKNTQRTINLCKFIRWKREHVLTS